MSPLILATDRLVIRPFNPDDLPVIHRILDQTFGDGTLVNDPAALDERRSWLHWSMLSEEWLPKMFQPPYGDRAIALKASGQLIGSIGYVPQLMPFEQIPEFAGVADPPRSATPAAARFTPEVGLFWTIDPDHQRRGYATEAARAMLDHAFSQMRLKRILATTDHDNLRSQAVMRKLGMRLLRNPWPEPRWMQVIAVLDNPAGPSG